MKLGIDPSPTERERQQYLLLFWHIQIFHLGNSWAEGFYNFCQNNEPGTGNVGLQNLPVYFLISCVNCPYFTCLFEIFIEWQLPIAASTVLSYYIVFWLIAWKHSMWMDPGSSTTGCVSRDCLQEISMSFEAIDLWLWSATGDVNWIRSVQERQIAMPPMYVNYYFFYSRGYSGQLPRISTNLLGSWS
jgi:hypothetical protein